MAEEKNGENFDEQILKDLEQFDSDSDSPEAAAGHVAEGPDIAIKVSEDENKVYARVKSPEDAETEVNKDRLLQELRNNNISFGISDEAIEEIFTYGSFNVDVIVARSKPPSNGEPATIEYKFETDPGKKQVDLEVDEHGNVDHRQVKLIDSVSEGDLLAVKVPPKPGEEGMTIYGKTIPAKDGKDIPLPLGENVKATDDGLGIVAAISGQPYVRDGKVSVSAVYEIEGDVSYKTGNVDFNGTVLVKGNVQSGFTVKASDDVEVHGNIDKAFIEAGGDVRVRGGLYGANEGKIVASGSVWVRSVDNGTIEAGHNIYLGQQSRMSTLMAGEKIVLNNMKGSIVGGKATAAEEFDVTNLGSASFTETIIELGMNPKVKQVHDDLENKIKEEKTKLDKITNHIKTLKEREKKQGQLTEKEQALMKKLVPMYHKLKSSLETDNKKFNFMNEKLKKLVRGRAKIRGTAFPGVKFYTMNATLAVKKDINFSSVSEKNEQIEVGPY